jgi:pimeloyl-ACP methyl ester carboxylesterase
LGVPGQPGAIARDLGENDEIFPPAGAEAFQRDLPDAEIRFLPTGHFALETHGAEIAVLVDDFLERALAR